MFAAKLSKAIKEKNNPCVVGLDPTMEMMPEFLQKKYNVSVQKENIPQMFLEFNKNIIDSVADLTPAIKVQVAFYERYGLAGIEAFYETLKYCKEKDVLTIADVKRGDIGSTALAYAEGLLQEPSIDSITVNPLFGTDGLTPFVDVAKKEGKGLFILLKTSNPSSAELQDLEVEGGQKVYHKISDIIATLDEDCKGEYSDMGVVVGATHPAQLAELRKKQKGFMLVPGYGAQGGSGKDIVDAFDDGGLGAVVNSSRGITSYYKKVKADEKDYAKFAKKSLENMIKDINSALAQKRGK
ncbi:orotidine-5'-phosphate decarboxylase [Proteinivorax hydrogeniformans]|uniref:Orotidine 5'-phosphate decarboxylase n=1 Tax=Proteinivorax hydrogeniformans TaxID=1826727 RepID=A0AAU8HPZ9_9FIRM